MYHDNSSLSYCQPPKHDVMYGVVMKWGGHQRDANELLCQWGSGERSYLERDGEGVLTAMKHHVIW